MFYLIFYTDSGIILIDDFIGSGNTVDRKVKWLQNKIIEKKKKGISLYLVSLAIMKSSIPAINLLDIEFYSPLVLNKGISDYKNADINIDIMKKIETKLSPKHRGEYLPRLGYKKSESLFAIEGMNIPNNVFPTLWWSVSINKNRRETIFQRLR